MSDTGIGMPLVLLYLHLLMCMYFAESFIYNSIHFWKFLVLNVGSLNCSRFGADPCKQNSECIDEKCICKPFFYQLGLDDVTSTECLPSE